MADHRAVTRPGRASAVHRLGSLVLTITAAIGAVCMVATVAAVLFDVKPLIFRSGSMAPEIDTGALAISRTTDAEELRVGDIVSVPNASGVRVTHRIVSTTLTATGTATLVLRGDANASPDSEPYVVETAERVLFDVPKAGYVVAWAGSPAGVFLGGLVVGASVLIVVSSSMRSGSAGTRRAGVAALALVLGVGASTTIAPEGTLAAFTDSATMTSGAVGSYKVPPPVISSCNDAGSNVVITWPAVSSPYGVTYSARVVETGEVLAVTADGANRRVTISPSFSFSLGGTATVRVFTALTPTYTSTVSDQRIVYGLFGLSVNCA